MDEQLPWPDVDAMSETFQLVPCIRVCIGARTLTRSPSPPSSDVIRDFAKMSCKTSATYSSLQICENVYCGHGLGHQFGAFMADRSTVRDSETALWCEILDRPLPVTPEV
jgi:hypothetical protein